MIRVLIRGRGKIIFFVVNVLIVSRIVVRFILNCSFSLILSGKMVSGLYLFFKIRCVSFLVRIYERFFCVVNCCAFKGIIYFFFFFYFFLVCY